MRIPFHAALLAVLGACAAAGRPSAEPATSGYALAGGHWFDGRRFVPRTLYVVDGRFSARRPARVDSTVSLAGGFVVPPFGDAHTHNLDGPFNFEKVRDAYLGEGTLYVQVLTNHRSYAERVRDRVNRPGSVDVVYANAGLTSTLGHPFMAYEPRDMGLYEPGSWKTNEEKIRVSRIGEGNTYDFVDSLAELDAKWPAIRAAHRDVLKIYLVDAARHRERRASGELGHHGLPPELVAPIVERAHAAGLRVWAHVETAFDFGVAARAGVDGFAHVPGYGLGPTDDATLYRIDPRDARIAGRRGVALTPTLRIGGPAATPADSVRRAALERENLQLLRRHGVRIVVGSDYFGQPARAEVAALRALGIWSDAELLAMWSGATPQAIFPGRRIGRLAPGYEASLLVLGCDPTLRFECVDDIRMLVKQGQRVSHRGTEAQR